MKVEVQIRQPSLAIIKPKMSVEANVLEKTPLSTEAPPGSHPGKGSHPETSFTFGHSGVVWPGAFPFAKVGKSRVALR